MSESHTQPKPIRLETDQPGLVLVQMLTREDDEAFFGLQNENIDFWQEFGNSIDDSVEAVTARRIEKNVVRFGIYKDGILIGMEGYVPGEDGREAEVGILLDKDATGHGYATSALKALSEHAASRFERVFAEAAPGNDSSIQLCTRAGYVLQQGTVQRDWGEAVVLEYAK